MRVRAHTHARTHTHTRARARTRREKGRREREVREDSRRKFYNNSSTHHFVIMSFLIKVSAQNNTINRTAYVCFEKYQRVCEHTMSKNYAFVMINEAKILYQINQIKSNVINL